MLQRLIRRWRKNIAQQVAPKPAWSRTTHTAYPEIQADIDGSWRLRFYAYEPMGWMFREARHAERPEWPEPTVAHPNTYPQVGEQDGRPIYDAPAECLDAWAAYYRDCPQPVTLVEEITGQAADKKSAQQQAHKALLQQLGKYRRQA